MRISMSLMLPALLTFSVAMSATGAPLAKKDATHSRIDISALRAIQAPQEETLPFAPEPEQPRIDGLFKVETELARQNRRAQRSATAARRAIAGNVDLRGSVVASSAWSGNSTAYGIYSMPHSQAEGLTLLASTDQIDAGFDNGEGVFYSTYIKLVMGFLQVPVLDTYDMETFTKLSSKTMQGDMSLMAADVDRDPTTGDVYGAFMRSDGSGPVWAKGDYEALTSTEIASFPAYPHAVACDKNGQYYVVCNDGFLYKVEKTTGEFTEVAPVEVPMQRYSTGCINNNNNTLIMHSYTSDGSGLYEIDLATGATSLVSQLPNHEHLRALHIVAPKAEPKAPDSPLLEVSNENGAMEATVKLTMPSTLFDGTPATGATFSYEVLANGEPVMQGEATAGEEIAKTIAFQQAGVVEFVATASNSDGVSPKTKTSKFIGKGVPAAPTNVTLSYADDQATITWDAVTTSSDGGFIDPDMVTYTVYDNDGTAVKEGITTTSCILPLPLPDTYMMIGYSVAAEYSGKMSGSAASNQVGIGAFSTPFSLDMKVEDNFLLHKVVDANDDKKTWNYGNGRTRYSYSLRADGDDWLFSPNVKLQSGKVYVFEASVSSFSEDIPERIEVLFGDAPEVEAMNQQVVDPTVVQTPYGTVLTLQGVLKPQADGTYNVGFHALSDAFSNYLYLNSYGIGEPISSSAPEQVSDITVKADETGDLKVAISCIAPSTSLGDVTLTGGVTVKVFRGEDLIHENSYTNGEAVDIEDTAISAKGDYTYTFLTVNSAGEEGIPVNKTVYVGPKTPAPMNKDAATLKETSPGNFHLEWEPVTADVSGTTLPASNITYDVFAVVQGEEGLTLGEQLNGAPVTDNHFDYVTEPVKAQRMVYMAVRASNRDVPGDAIVVSTLSGEDYQLPVRLSSAADLRNYVIFYGGGGSIAIGSSEQDYQAQDGDDNYFVFQNGYPDDITYLQTGKIAIDGDNPVLSFYLMPLADDDINITSVYVEVDGEMETEPLLTITNSDLVPEEWNKLKVSLAPYVGKTVTIAIFAQCVNIYYTLIDNIQVKNELPYDVAARISAPASVEADKEFTIAVNLTNEGSEDTGSFSVDLLKNGEVAATREFTYGIAADESEQVMFRQTLGLQDASTTTFQAVVNYEADMNPANDKTGEVVVRRSVSTLPMVTGLDGSQSDGGNILTWDALDLDKELPVMKTDTFEDADSWSHQYGDWVFMDIDESPVSGLKGITIPGITAGVTLSSFFVFDCADEEFNSTFDALAGTRYLASLAPSNKSQVDDWAISPMLSGHAQTISFWAKSYHGSYPEKIEVYYSMEGIDMENFVKVEEFGSRVISDIWTEYTANLPEGARHFAIRSCATGGFILMIDDISYMVIGKVDATLLGYNIYCDGVKLNDTPLAQPTYTHAGATGEDHTYRVSAVFDKGESELSSPLTLMKSGIDLAGAESLKVSVEGKAIVVTGADGERVVINGVDGRTLHAAEGDIRVTVPQAVYLVTVGRKTFKVIVR